MAGVTASISFSGSARIASAASSAAKEAHAISAIKTNIIFFNIEETSVTWFSLVLGLSPAGASGRA